MCLMINFIIKINTESINSEPSFDTKIVWLGLTFVLKLGNL